MTHRSKPRARLRQFIRRQSPVQSPPFRWWHALLLLGLLLAVAVTFWASGVMADVGASAVAPRQWLVRLAVTVVGLIAYNVFWVRALPAWRVASYMIVCLGLLFTIARNEYVTHNPLTVSLALLLLGLMVEAGAIAVRPNPYERLNLCEAELRRNREDLNDRDNWIDQLMLQARNKDDHISLLIAAREGDQARIKWLAAENERLKERT